MFFAKGLMGKKTKTHKYLTNRDFAKITINVNNYLLKEYFKRERQSERQRKWMKEKSYI